MWRALKSERGSILPLAFGFAALGIAVIITVTNAASLYLEKKRLLSVADAASLAAAEGFSIYQDVTLSNGRLHYVPTEAAARVAEYVSRYRETSNLDGLRLERVSLDGPGAEVVVGSSWRPPLLGFIFAQGFSIQAKSYARGHFRAPD